MLIIASYFENIDRLFSPQYLPDHQDVLHSYVKTEGIVESRLKLGKLDYLFIDVGDVRSETWIHFGDSAHCVIFTAPLSGYDELYAGETAVGSLLAEALLLKYPHSLLTLP